MKTLYCLAILLLLGTTNSNAQIPNASFEQWDTDGNPVGWTTSNIPEFISTVMQSSVSVQGASSARGVVVDGGGQNYPPVLISTSPDGYGFPISTRPAALTGFLATTLEPNDGVYMTVSINVGTEPIGVGALIVTNSNTSLSSFTIPIQYISNVMPDSAIIVVQIATSSADLPKVGSSFTIDALAFADAATVEERVTSSELRVTNSSDGYEITCENPTVANTKLDVLDVHGRSAGSLYDGTTDRISVRWNGHNLANGMYILRLTANGAVQYRKIVLAR